MLTIFCFIALDSPESAAKRVVLMKNMSDVFSRATPLHPSRLHSNWEDKGQAVKHIYGKDMVRGPNCYITVTK